MDDLLHARPYDPVKAREYYLRTRKLKGRKKGVADEPVGRERQAQVDLHSKRTTKSKLDPKQRREAVQAEVAALKKRLERLKEVLAQLVKEAQARSGQDTSETKDKKPAEKDSGSEKPQTQKQKRDAAERSREAYEKEKKQNPNKELETLKTQIKDIKAKIQAALADAQKRSERKPTSQTAAKAVDTNRKGDSQNGS